MSNFVTMVFVLGGTLIFGGVLLYFSLLPGSPRNVSSKRRTAAEATAVVAAASDRDREETP
ncbi:hypothetical protein [Hyphomicrobium sp.]|uniref:hypothetical protein n=1 Tax=Hyphomicrobium sp. TaxID=82 RepID=UPI000FA0E9C5|nr:hypothetical protein [Hyphomicrobium sp.]RUP11193.1 MAG: hypothetical protein EKK38_01715 [Hyphomicrobium sp.]